MHKSCSRCKVEFPLTSDFFYRNKSNTTGFNTQCKLCAARGVKVWKNDNSSRNVLKEAHKAWRRKNPDKRNVRQRVYMALKKGLIKKKECAVCDKVKVEAHHFNYSKPLEVIWLCNKHHVEVHSCQKK